MSKRKQPAPVVAAGSGEKRARVVNVQATPAQVSPELAVEQEIRIADTHRLKRVSAGVQSIVDSLEEPACLVDNDQIVRAANAQALEILGPGVIGSLAAKVLCAGDFKKHSTSSRVARFAGAGNNHPSLPVEYRVSVLSEADKRIGSLVSFTLKNSETQQQLPGGEVAVVPGNANAAALEIEAETTMGSRADFTETLDVLLADDQRIGSHCVVVLEVDIVAATGDRLDLGSSAPMLEIVSDALRGLYSRKESIAYIDDGRFAFLVATRRLPDALVFVRKLLQIIPRLVRYTSNLKLAVRGTVLEILKDEVAGAPELLERCIRPLSTSTRLKDNSALVIHLNQILSAYPDQRSDKTAQVPVDDTGRAVDDEVG